MSPIFGLSERNRMPRLGKIHLGVKVPNKSGQGEHPEAVDYFVLPPDLQAVYGEKPTSLEIVFPVDDDEIIASQWRRAYSATRGLVCKGNGQTARRLVNVKLRKPDPEGVLTGPIADHTAQAVEWCQGILCPGDECPYTVSKACKPVMNLQFMLPRALGLGIWQLDTGSVFSILNVNSGLRLVRALVEHMGGTASVAMVPLRLDLIEQEVAPDGKKKTIHVLQITIAGSLAQLAVARKSPFAALMPPPDEERPEMLYDEALGNVLDAAPPTPLPIPVTVPPPAQRPAPQRPPERPPEGKLAGTNLDVTVGQPPAQAVATPKPVAEQSQSAIVEEAGRRPISKPLLDRVNQLLVASKTATAEVKKQFGVSSLADLTASQGAQAVAALERKTTKQAQAPLPLTPAEQEADQAFDELHEDRA